MDNLQRFIFEHADIRGEIVHLHQSFTTIIEQHNYPPIIRYLLGEALLTAVLMCATIKFQGQLTMQYQSEGPIKLLVAKCDDEFNIRGLAQFNPDILLNVDDTHRLLGDGQLVVTLQPKNTAKPYQSIIPLHHDGIAKSLERYFAQSEQLSTRIWLAVEKEKAVGMLLQLLPEQSARDREDFWQHAVKLGETITEKELLTLDNTTILKRLYHEEDIRLFDSQSVQFKCTCDRTRMENAIKMFGQEEAESILTDKHFISVTCEFCNQNYNFDKVDVAKIFHA